MIKGINQSMVNRTIAGGICKCINHGGSTTQKFTFNFNVYTKSGTNYILKNDLNSICNAVGGIDPTQYRFTYGIINQPQEEGDIYNIKAFPLSVTAEKSTAADSETKTIKLSDIGSTSGNLIDITYEKTGDADPTNTVKLSGNTLTSAESVDGIPEGYTTAAVTLALYYESA